MTRDMDVAAWARVFRAGANALPDDDMAPLEPDMTLKCVLRGMAEECWKITCES